MTHNISQLDPARDHSATGTLVAREVVSANPFDTKALPPMNSPQDNDSLTSNPFPDEPALAPFQPYDTSPPIPCQLCLSDDCYGH